MHNGQCTIPMRRIVVWGLETRRSHLIWFGSTQPRTRYGHLRQWSAISYSYNFSDGNVYAMNTSTGSSLWDVCQDGAVRQHLSPSTVELPNFGSMDDKLHAVNALNGSLIWSYVTGNDIIPGRCRRICLRRLIGWKGLCSERRERLLAMELHHGRRRRRWQWSTSGRWIISLRR